MTNLKKVLLASAAIAMLSSAAYAAGNESVLNQTGDDGTVALTQSGNSNNSNISQAGDDNGVGVTQSGNSNESDVTQGNTATNSNVTVDQSGFSGEVGINQIGGDDNTATLKQSGSDNWIGDDDNNVAGQGPLTQNGDRNELTVNQSGTNNDVNQGNQTGDENHLTIDQGLESGSSNNSISFNQAGQNNGDLFTGNGNGQQGTADAVLPARNGTDPFFNTNYGAVDGGTERWGYIKQEGKGNILTLDQDASGDTAFGNGIIAQQRGNGGDVDVGQSGGANFAYVDQRNGGGLRNGITITQDNTGANDINNYNLADVRQGGSGNTASVTQNANRQEAFIDQQFASGSTSTISQGTGGIADFLNTGNFAASVQNGEGLSSSIDQMLASDSDATVRQTGNGSSSEIEQAGDLLTATVTQTGDDHVSTLQQSGFQNTFTLTQTGNGNMSNAVQGGTGNTATINQSGQ